MSFNFYSEEEENNKEDSIDKFKDIFLKYVKKIPTLEEALIEMFKSSKLDNNKVMEFTDRIVDKCKKKISPKLKEIQNKYNEITEEDALIICSYTYELKEEEYNPYRILNKNLSSKDRENGVTNISKYLYILLKALRKLPRYYPKNNILYRCLNDQVDLSQGNNNKVSYKIGNKKTFWGFTSTSLDPKESYNFLKKEEGNKTGTVFSLNGDIWGYNIDLFSYYPLEKEILLEPERKYIISILYLMSCLI